MAKDREAGKLVSPENLWAKPMPGAKTEPAQTKATRMRTEDDDNMDDEDIDVDAELAEEDSYGKEVEEDADAELAAEDETETGDEPADDEDEIDDYESEDGDEIVAEDKTETAVSAVDADDVDDDETDETEVVSTKESRTTRMAEKKKTSLSDHVRNEIDKRKASGASIRGVDIVAALEKRGINVSAAQVSQLLKKAGLSSGKRGRPAASKAAGGDASERPRAALKASKKPAEEPKARATVSRKPAPEPTRMAPKAAPKTGNGFNVPMDQLNAAAEFVSACGGSFEKASRILDAASKLSQAFGG
jgi:hypothetical protein